MFTVQKTLPSAQSVKNAMPLDSKLNERKLQFDKQLKQNLCSKQKFVVVIGPCSADNVDAVTEYAQKLKAEADKHPNLLVVVRVYTAKPHSNGEGYKGLCFHQKLADSVDLEQGILQCRKLMINCLEIGLPIADELLYPELYQYFDDLVSYWFIGARSSDDNLHREFASGLDLCCGVKNNSSGAVDQLVKSVYATSLPSHFPFRGRQIATSGNKFAHVVLRGGLGEEGFFQNISVEQIERTKLLLAQNNLSNFVMVDLSHANSGKIAIRQLENAKQCVSNGLVDGIMAESYLFEGTHSDCYGVSKTDDCLNFENTKLLLQILAENC